ncbi:MAG: hypothetical protein ACRD36_01170 [Candidatus Acidiferrum sp.]
MRETTALPQEALEKWAAETAQNNSGRRMDRKNPRHQLDVLCDHQASQAAGHGRLPKALPRKLDPAKQEAFRRRPLFPCVQG